MKIPFKEECLIVSLFDFTKAWAKPWIDAGYPVMCHDKKIEGDILEGFSWLQCQIEETGLKPYGYLFAPPCTPYAVSGARWWAAKDVQPPLDGDVWSELDYYNAYVLICLHLIDVNPPTNFWALENPVGRLERLIPELKPCRKMMFDPCDYGDPYTKKTILWGDFNTTLIKNQVAPEFVEYKRKDGGVARFAPQFGRTGGKSEKVKTIRSATPMGFSNAFFEANKCK